MKRFLAAICLVAAVGSAQVQTIRRNAGFNANSVPRNDDGSTGLVPLGFTADFFGKQRSACYVNNNGNITFDAALSTFTPFGLVRTAREIIAPFFSDVDTRPEGSRLVTYGQDTIDGKAAFGVNYVDVGYFSNHFDKLNRFQLVLIDRADTGRGNFDIEFNYERIQWETGDASGGTNGFGGTPAAVGWSNGTGEPGTFYEWPGSLISGSFLDGGRYALIRQRLNSTLPGRIVFRARDGIIAPSLDISTSGPLAPGTVGASYSYALRSVGGTAPYRWSWSPDVELPPGLTLSDAGEIRGIPTQAGSWNLNVTLTAKTEDGDRTVTRRVTISVRPPQLQISTACPLPLATANRPYTQAFRASGLTAGSRFAWSVEDPNDLPPGMTFNPEGQLAGTPLQEGIYNFLVRAESPANDGSQAVTRSCKLEVRGAELSMLAAESCQLSGAVVGVPYLQRLTVNGGYDPYRWTVRGQLPVGLSLSPTGEITGIPTLQGEYDFSVDVRDARGQTQSRQCSLSARASELSIQGCPLTAGSTADAFASSLTATGGTAPYTFSVSGALPAGLQLSQDGHVTGTPRQAGPFRFRAIAADSEGRMGSTNCSVSILTGSLALAPCLPQGSVGEFYQRSLAVTGGDGPYYFRFSGLPEGLTGSTRGVVDGTPAAPGDYPYTVEVTDGKGNSVNRSCLLVVRPQPLRLTSACPLPAANLGKSYSQQLQATGGQAPYRFTFSGALPAGINANEDGSFNGTATQIVSRDFVVEVQDAAGNSTRQACALSTELPKAPQMRVTGLPATVSTADSTLAPVIELSEAYSEPIEGILVLEQTTGALSSDGLANQPDPRVRFRNGQQVMYFTIPAGTRRFPIPIATSGTVAGSVTLRVTDLRSARATLPGYADPAVYRIGTQAPSLTEACFTRLTGGAVEVSVTGLSNTRELQWAAVQTGSQTKRLRIESEASEYFANDTSVRFGGTFNVKFVTSVDGNPSTLNVTISNAIGVSQTRQASLCR